MIPPPRLAVNGVENALRERIKVAGKRQKVAEATKGGERQKVESDKRWQERQKVAGTENRNSKFEVL